MESSKVQLLEQIEIDSIVKFLTQYLGCPIILEKSINKERNSLQICSQDIKRHTGVLDIIYNKVTIGVFCSGFTAKNEEYWINLSFNYEYKSGGTNSTNFLSMYWIFDEGGWVYVDSKTNELVSIKKK